MNMAVSSLFHMEYDSLIRIELQATFIMRNLTLDLGC